MAQEREGEAGVEIVACIGSNAEDAGGMVLRGVDFLKRYASGPKGLCATPIFRCGESAYANALVAFESWVPAAELQRMAKDFERECGRTPESKVRGVIELDIDIVMADGEVLRPTDYKSNYFQEGLNLLERVDR